MSKYLILSQNAFLQYEVRFFAIISVSSKRTYDLYIS